MLFLLSPAKSLDYETPVPAAVARLATEPQFMAQAAELIALLRQKSVAQVAELMDLSDKLASLNAQRFADWHPQASAASARPAVLAFNGDVYDGLDAKTLSVADLRWAQQHLAMLSGLYGVLRPLDRLQAYRLEMGTRLPNARGSQLYAFWGESIAHHLNAITAHQSTPTIVNLASQEYFKAVQRKALRPPVVACQFQDRKQGQYKVISFFAKRARGLMARWAIQERVHSVAQLRDFDLDGYAFVAEASTSDALMFRRCQE